MSSALKTLDLLSHFSAHLPEIGLSDFCRLSGRDKATTYRYLQTLEKAGFVEQNPDTKRYRLGPIVLQLAQVREATVPRKTGARAPLEALAEATGETSHVSVLAGDTLYALDACESHLHSTRVIIDIPKFPLHATASGLCALAFGPAHLMAVAQVDMQRFTASTPTTQAAVETAVASIRTSGIGRSAGNYQSDSYSLSAPLFDASGAFAGAVSVASVATRFTHAAEQTIRAHLIEASRQITHNWGGTTPAAIEHAWARTSLTSQNLAPAQDIAS